MIDSRILSRSKLKNILPVEVQVTLSLAWEESEHPRGQAGKFAPKGKTTSKIGGRQYSRGKQRFIIEQGETQAEAYKRALSEAQKKRLKKQGKRILSRSQFKQGLNDWQKEANRQQYEEIRQAAQAGESHPALTAAKEAGTVVGVHYGLGKVKDIISGVFKKFGKKKISTPTEKEVELTGKVKNFTKPIGATTTSKTTASAASKINIVRKTAAQQSAKKAFQQAGGRAAGASARSAAKAAYKAGTKSIIKDIATASTAQAATQTASKLVPTNRLANAGTALFGTRLLGLTVPQIGIAALVGYAGYRVYKNYKNKQNEESIIAHERELMRQEQSNKIDEDREFNKQLREQTARDVARQASIYAAKQYAKSQVEHQKREIDETIQHKSTQKKMKRSARITAHAAAKEYAAKERSQAYKTRESDSLLYFSHDK